MGVRIKHLIGGLLIGGLVCGTSVLTASKAIAQSAPTTNRQSDFETIPQAFDRVFFDESGDIFVNRSVTRQLDFFFGFGSNTQTSFIENELAEDARRLNLLYVDVMNQQVSSTPLIRTQDLPSPYTSSLLFAPPQAILNSRAVGSELVYEPLPGGQR